MLGLIADIHGNAWALEAVLADAHRRGVAEFVNLGDVLYGPLAPRKTFDLLRQVNLVAQVRGNQDRLILDGPRNPTLDWVRSDLGDEPLGWLAALPALATYQDRLLCHGSPSSDTIYLREDVSAGFARVRSDREIQNLLGSTLAPWVFCGHTHVQRMVKLTSGQTIVNPGSVGLPAYYDDAPVPHVMESFSPHARYATMEGSAISFHHVEYDWNTAAMKAIELGREDWALAIATGRMASHGVSR
jgi:diadenosine tetraphosphatase ApaH/serine/threonine PP2A family protein phosphatase